MKFVRKPIKVEAIRLRAENFLEIVDITGKRNVGTPEDPYLVEAFTSIGTYLLAYHHPNSIAELWIDSEQRLVPVHWGDWIAQVEGYPGFFVFEDDGTGNSPLFHEKA